MRRIADNMKSNIEKFEVGSAGQTEHRELVMNLLGYHGFSVTSIRLEPGGSQPSAELLARQGKEQFAITVCPCVAAAGEAPESEPAASRNGQTSWARLMPMARGAARDTRGGGGRASSGVPGPFQISWVHFEGEDAGLELDRARASLYGTVVLAELGAEPVSRASVALGTERSQRRQCYYFTEGVFSRCRDTLDAVILSRSSRLLLCVNSLAERAVEFRTSSLARAFSESVVDPDRWERSHLAYILDGAIDRRDRARCLKYLREKYHTGRLVTLPWRGPARRNGACVGATS
jgi:hypothetical protein